MTRIKSTRKYQQPIYPTDMEGNEITLNTNDVPKFIPKKKKEVVPATTTIDEISDFVNSKQFQEFTSNQKNFNNEFGKLNLNLNTSDNLFEDDLTDDADWVNNVNDGGSLKSPNPFGGQNIYETPQIDPSSIVEKPSDAPKITTDKPEELTNEEFWNRYQAYINKDIPNEVIPPVSFVSKDDQFSCMSCHAFTGVGNTNTPTDREIMKMNMLGFNYQKYKDEGWDEKFLQLGMIPAAVYAAPTLLPMAAESTVGQSVGTGVKYLGNSMNATRFGVPGLTGTNTLNAGFITHGIMSLPNTINSWSEVDMNNPDSWVTALDNTFWNTIDFLGVPQMLKELKAGPAVMNKFLDLKKWAKKKLIGERITIPHGQHTSDGVGVYMGEHTKWKEGILPKLENKIMKLVNELKVKAGKTLDPPNTTYGGPMVHDSGISQIRHSHGDYNVLMETYKPNYITTTTGETINMVQAGKDKTMATYYVDKLMLDHMRFPKETKNLITNSNRIIKESGGLKNMTMDQLAKDPDALLGVFLKNRKTDYNSLQSGYFNKGLAEVEIGGKKYMIIRRNRDYFKTKETMSLHSKGAPSNVGTPTHIVEVNEVGKYITGNKRKFNQTIEGWMDEVVATEGQFAQEYVTSYKGTKFDIINTNTHADHLYLEVQPFLEGKAINTMSAEDLARFSPENVQNLLSSITKSKKAGADIDFINPNNFLFNPKTGNVNIVDVGVTDKFKNTVDITQRRREYVEEVRKVVSTMYKSMLDDLVSNKKIFSQVEKNSILLGAKEKPLVIHNYMQDMKAVLTANPEKKKILKHFNTLTKNLTNAIENELKLLGVTPLLIPAIMGETNSQNNGNKQQ